MLVHLCHNSCKHLEVVTDLSTETFLLAFQRFVSQNSQPQIVLFDNASTYLSANEDIKTLFESEDLKQCLSRCGMTMRFIPKRDLGMGGSGKH